MDVLLRYEDDRSPEHPLSDRYAGIRTGVPGRCPACAAFGFITAVDVHRSFQSQHCRACGYRWEYTFRDDGTISEVRGSGPLPDPEPLQAVDAPDVAEPVPDPTPAPAAVAGTVDRRRIVVRRRNRPLRAQRTTGKPAAAGS